MNKIYVLFLVFFSLVSRAQDGLYTDVVIRSDYDSMKSFTEEKKGTVHSLRVYLQNKDAELDGVMRDVMNEEGDLAESHIDTLAAKEFLAIVDKADKNALMDDRLRSLLTQFGYMSELYGKGTTVGNLDGVVAKVRKKTEEYRQSCYAISTLYMSKKNISTDIRKAQARLDELYGKVYDEGVFRITITAFFSAVIGGLLLLFFAFINRRADAQLARDFLSSGNGLQFITLFSLITAIILFGVLGILEGRELAAILAGISGYILGKGIANPIKPTPEKPAEEVKPLPVAHGAGTTAKMEEPNVLN